MSSQPVRLVAARCPGCGAGLKIQSHQEVARCAYCDAESRVVRPGTVGRGHVLELGLAITRPDGSTYQLAKRSRVPAVLVGRLRSGMTVPVLADPDDPSRVEIPWHLVSGDG